MTPETLDNNVEQEPSSNMEAENPTFNPEEAQKRIADYKAEHPDVVEDVEKARFMAQAEDPYRTQAIENRKDATAYKEEAEESYLEGFKADAQKDYTAAGNAIERAEDLTAKALEKKQEAKENDRGADAAGEKAGEFYDQLNGE